MLKVDVTTPEMHPKEKPERSAWKRLVVLAILAIGIPASVVAATAAPAAAMPACSTPSAAAVWSTQRAYNFAPGRWCVQEHYTMIAWQSDGNLVWYDKRNLNPMWASGTNGKGATRLSFQVDGNIVIYNSRGVALWAIGGSSNRRSTTTFYWTTRTAAETCGLSTIKHVLTHYQFNPDATLHVRSRCGA
jgi:hypothetical protein